MKLTPSKLLCCWILLIGVYSEESSDSQSNGAVNDAPDVENGKDDVLPRNLREAHLENLFSTTAGLETATIAPKKRNRKGKKTAKTKRNTKPTVTVLSPQANEVLFATSRNVKFLTNVYIKTGSILSTVFNIQQVLPKNDSGAESSTAIQSLPANGIGDWNYELDLPIDDMEPGDYVLTVTGTTRAGKSATSSAVPFTIEEAPRKLDSFFLVWLRAQNCH